MLNYTDIFYYGQNCDKKFNSLAEYNKKDGGYQWMKGDHIHYRY